MALKLGVATWIGLVIGVVGLALYRKWVASGEDDTIHISGDGLIVEKQQALSKRLEVIDRWGKTLTVLTAVFGILLLAAIVYVAWQQPPVLELGQ